MNCVNKYQDKNFVVFLGKLAIIIAVISITLLIGNFVSSSVPNAEDCKKDNFGNFESVPGRICVTYARKLLNELSDMGPKPHGSDANEITVRFLTDHLKHIKSLSGDSMILKYEVQKSNQNIGVVQNVIARLSQNTTSKALLINSHFDSSRRGPGASDDGINVSIMLEVLRNMVLNPKFKMHYDIIFLFNGAEERRLVGSTAFIEHRWSNDIIAFINLEAMGSGGKELLFQSTSNKLMESYKRAAKFPFATVVGQDIFHFKLSGKHVIPSYTDFGNFEKLLKIGGLDFAFINNGYVYHTANDIAAIIPDGSIQQAGDNLLLTTHDFVTIKPESYEKTKFNYDMVFFDILGNLMISYPWQWFGMSIHLLFSCTPFLMLVIDMIFRQKVVRIQKGTKTE